MFYLALVLSRMNTEVELEKRPKIGFGYAFGQQFLNSKAWIMAISGAGAFMPRFSSIHVNVLLFAGIFAVVGIPSMFIWLKMGDVIARIIKSEKANRIVGYTLFFLMLVTIAMIWI